MLLPRLLPLTDERLPPEELPLPVELLRLLVVRSLTLEEFLLPPLLVEDETLPPLGRLEELLPPLTVPLGRPLEVPPFGAVPTSPRLPLMRSA